MRGNHSENIRLLYGPYRTPKCRVGSELECEARGRTVIIAGISDAPIQWPYAKKRGKQSLILCGNLVNAVAVEAVLAVAYHWGVSRSTVNSWRRALGVPTNNPGTLRLKRYYSVIGQEMVRSPESRAKMSAAHAQRAPCPQFKAAALAAAKKPKSEAWKKAMSLSMKEQWAKGLRQPRGRRG
jgi:hypothetical protein